MGEVIAFRSAKRADRLLQAASAEDERRIVFFTGVRYQRGDDPGTAASTPVGVDPPADFFGGAPAGGRKRRRRG